MNKGFGGYHPLVNFLYFTVILLYTMFMMHPFFLVLSVIGSCVYSVYLNGRKAVKFNLLAVVPLIILSALFNPLFNHQGITILGYFSSGNPLTLESIVYGFAAALMFAAVIMWFSCYNVIMTSDKFIYLFGRIIPSVSLVLAMILRFVPKFKEQAQKISAAQKCIGRDVSNGTILQKAKNGMKIISILTTWALENGIDTADSMRSRGYGLPGRTSFSIFTFDGRDKTAMLFLASLTLLVFSAIAANRIFIVYYPQISVNPTTIISVIIYICYGLLCFFPLIIDISEDLKWRVLQSRI